MQERLQKILSAHGVASRRESERLIISGHVTVNGQTAAVGQSADDVSDIIAIDGVPLRKADEKVYIMLNKPRDYVTTLRDEKGRKNVSDLVAGCGMRVYPIGRLDLDSEGLLLMTNDGELTHLLSHPSNEKEKTYLVRVTGDIDGAIKPMSEPMIIDGYTIRPAGIKLLKKEQEAAVLSITIHEGRNRQIRKMCALANLKVLALQRVAEGGIQLGRLKTGTWRYLSESEIRLLKRATAVSKHEICRNLTF
jgi:23S rRNA pseudouridine2605 synthase